MQVVNCQAEVGSSFPKDRFPRIGDSVFSGKTELLRPRGLSLLELRRSLWGTAALAPPTRHEGEEETESVVAQDSENPSVSRFEINWADPAARADGEPVTLAVRPAWI